MSAHCLGVGDCPTLLLSSFSWRLPERSFGNNQEKSGKTSASPSEYATTIRVLGGQNVCKLFSWSREYSEIILDFQKNNKGDNFVN